MGDFADAMRRSAAKSPPDEVTGRAAPNAYERKRTEPAAESEAIVKSWSKDFLEAGKKQLAGDTLREATSDEVKDLRNENRELKEVVAEIKLKNRVLKKSLTGLGEEDAT